MQPGVNKTCLKYLSKIWKCILKKFRDLSKVKIPPNLFPGRCFIFIESAHNSQKEAVSN